MPQQLFLQVLLNLDLKYEEFLLNIAKVAHDESGGYVILTSSKKKPMEYMVRYDDGLQEYLKILSDIRKISESI